MIAISVAGGTRGNVRHGGDVLWEWEGRREPVSFALAQTGTSTVRAATY